MDGAKNNNRQTDNIEGEIKVLMKALADLAPHPDRPDYYGPLFISEDANFNPPTMLEGVLGAVFTNAANSNNQIAQINRTADMHAGIINGLFNRIANFESLRRAYYVDLPKRLGLEANIAASMRKLCSARKNALRYARLQAA